MPWKLQKQDNGYVVVDDKGKKYSKKPISKSRATRQMRALYASESKEKALTLKEVHTGVMVAWKVPPILGELFKALVEKSTGPMYSEQPADMHMTIAYAGDIAFQGVTREEAAKGDYVEVFELKDWEQEAKPEEKESLSVFKQGTDWRWVLRSSTAYRDKDGEIVSIKALQNDCDRADADGNYGPLRWWHIPGMDIGDCDFNMVYGKTLIESGTFRSDSVAQAVAKEAKNLQVSIGFNHPRTEPDASGVFHTIKRFERSLLPMGRASNPFTAVPAVRKEQDMTSIPDKLKAFAAILKDETAMKAILDSVTAEEKAADAKGVEFKESDEETAEKQKPCKTEDKGMEAMNDEDEEGTEEDEGEDKGKSFDDGPFVGDLTPDEFGAMMANVITKAIDPVMKSVKELQGEQEKTKESRTNEIASVTSQIRALEARLKELEGSTPKAAKGYVASQATDNLVGEDHRLKDAAPAPDPAGGFFDFALGK